MYVGLGVSITECKYIANLPLFITLAASSHYGLTFKFNNPTDRYLGSLLRIETSSGLLMHEEKITFRPTRGKWRNVITSTGTDINAGHYRIILKLKEAKDLLIQRVEIQ